MARKKNPLDKKKYKLDIFEVLENIDKRNFNYYATLDDNLKKEFVPFVTMKWLSQVNASPEISEYYLLMVNDLLNREFWALRNHPELIWKLMCVIGIGQKMRHEWVPMTKQSKTPKLDELFKKKYPTVGEKELETLRRVATKDAIVRLCEDLGMEKKEHKPYLDELKKIHGK